MEPVADTNSLALLGEWRLTVGGRSAVAPAYEKGRALLAYLAIENRWLSREMLGGLFWPDSFGHRANLRQVLANLRAVLKDEVAAFPCLLVRRDAISISAEFIGTLDATAFSASPPRCDEAGSAQRCKPCLRRMEQAIGLYRGEFMAGFSLTDCPDFEEWLRCKREEFQRHAVALCGRLADCHERYGELQGALTFSRRMTELDPWDEGAQRRLMRLLVASGQNAAALRQYEKLEASLMRDLGIRPEEATREIYHGILVGDGGVPPDTENRRVAAVATLPEKEKSQPEGSPQEEVRRVVVLLVEPDLGDDTELFDPEDYLAPLGAELDAALSRWNGRRFATTGPTFGAVFGLPGDGEQAPRRALRAALEIAALPEFSRTRIGICEGKTLVGQAAGQLLEGSALPALAQRLALCGEPGDVIVAESLTGELGPSARFEPQPRRRFTGLAGEHTPCQLVVAASTRGTPFPMGFSTPFVGRKEVCADLTAALGRARNEGRAVFVEVTGPPGTGKSRLLAELAREHSAAGGEVRWISHCPELCHVSLGALREALRRRIGRRIAAGDNPLRPIDLDDWLKRFFPARREMLRPLIRTFLALADDSVMDISGRGLLDALITLLFSPSTRNKPVLLVFDDLHWADKATLELIQFAVQSPPAAPILAVLASRPHVGVAPPYGVAVPNVTLEPLTLSESLDLIRAIDKDGRIDAAQQIQIAKMSGGLPLCTEYVARTARDQQVSDASLFGVFQNVLDRLGPDKQILQAAAVFGTTFRGAGLRALLPGHDPVGALKRAEALAISGRTGKNIFAFRHALLRDCAYESIPPKLRRIWHHRAATWLAQQADVAPADIAQHFDQARAWREARDFWWKAARTAYQGGFARDAKEAAMRALEAAAKDSDPIAKEDKAELELLAGFATLMIEGYGSKKAQRLFEPIAVRARGELPDDTLIRALSGLAMATPQSRQETKKFMIRIDEMARLSVHRVVVCYGLGADNFWRGEFAESLRCFDETIRLGESLHSSDWLPYCAANPIIACRAFKGIDLAFLGDAPAALESGVRAITEARREGRVYGLCFAITLSSITHLILDHPDQVEQLAAEGLDLATKWNLPFWKALNTMFGLWAKARQGRLRVSESFNLMSMYRDFAAASRMSPVTALWFAGCILEAMESWSLLNASAGRGLALAEKGGDRFCAPDLMRQKALVRHARGDVKGARLWLQQAHALATTQGSLGLIRRIVQSSDRMAISLLADT